MKHFPSFLFLAVFVSFIVYCGQAAARVGVVADSISVDTRCANNRMGRGKCPQGHQYIPPVTVTPFLTFSDLTNGPDVGLGDGLGSGAIVTLWGYNLGSSQNGSIIRFRDSLGTARTGHVYYWKNADGALPSGPANLYESHGMQEIAFSIPDSAVGPGTIEVVTSQGSTSLPFSVRAGNIYHVRSTGSDSNAGTYAAPFQTVAHTVTLGSDVPAGSIVYIHDVDSGDNASHRGIYWNNASAASTLDNQFGLVAYPNTRPTTTGQYGFQPYNTSGAVVSKLDVYASNYIDVDANGQPQGAEIRSSTNTVGVHTTANGRVIANRITDIPGGCASKYAGAISGTAQSQDYASNAKIYGNEIYDYSCEGATKLHHTTYMSVRSGPDDLQLAPWEFGYNYLHDNWAKFGIHQFDQDDGCGDLTGPLRIHNNVIINQAGAGISIGSQCGWTMDAYIENNLLVNVGLAADWDGLDINTADGPENGGMSFRDSGDAGLTGTMYVTNNTIWNWNYDSPENGAKSCIAMTGQNGDSIQVIWNDNICATEHDQPFLGFGYNASMKADNISGSNNIFYDASGNAANDNIPVNVSGSILTDPQLLLEGNALNFNLGSSIINASTSTLPRDLYGNTRGSFSNIGAINGTKVGQ